MAAGVKTSPEVEDNIRDLVRSGHTARQVSEALGVSRKVLTRVVRDTPGLDWARTGAASSGTPESAAKARGVQSEHARNRRAVLYDRTLDEYERTLDLLAKTLTPRDRLMYSQALAAKGKAATDISANDAKAAPDMQVVVSMIDKFIMNAELVGGVLPPPRPGLIQE